MAKLSQQLKAGARRLTRTQRQRNVTAERKYQEALRQQELQEKAQKVHEEKFQDVKSIDDYEMIYNEVDPELQQFFTTPTTLRQEKAVRISEIKIKVNERQSYATERLKQITEEYERRKLTQSQDGMKDLRDDYDEDVQYWKGYQQGLGEGLGKLNAGQEISYSDIESFASDKGSYEEDRETAKNENRKAQKKAFAKLLEHPFATDYIKAKEKYGNKIDWTNEANIKAINQSVYLEQYGDYISRDIALGKTDSVFVQRYKEVVGEKKFEEVSKDIKAEYQELQLAELEKRKEEREPKLDIEKDIEKKEVGWFRKSASFVIDIPSKIYSGIKKTPIPIFTAGAGTGSLTIGGIVEDKTVRDTTENVVSTTISGVGKVFDYGRKVTGDIGIPIFTAGTGSTQIFTVREGLDPTNEMSIISDMNKLSTKLRDVDVGQKALEEKYIPIFQAEAQAEFEDKYGEPIIMGDITEEQALKEFEVSDEAKLVQERYSQAIEKERSGKITWKEGGVIAGLTGLNLGKFIINLAPQSLSDIAIETAVITGGVYGYKAIAPAIPIKTLLGAGIVWGTARTFDPRSSPEQIVGGIVLAGTSASLLGYQLYKYLKPPVIVRTKIPKLKISVKADTVYLKDGKLYEVTAGGKTKLIDYVVDPKVLGTQTIRVDTTAGMRSVVYSSKFKQLLGFKPIYQGIPTMQKGTTIAYESIRGTVISTTPSAYQKSLALLEKSNTAWLTSGGETQLISLKGMNIKYLLRYTAPTVKITTIESQILQVVGDKARGQAFVLTEQPVLNVDKLLGIKTRGAKTIRDFYQIEKYLKGDYVITDMLKTKMFVTPEGASYQKLTQAGKTTIQYRKISKVNVKDIEESFAKLQAKILKGDKVIWESEVVRQPYRYQDLTEKYVLQQTVPFKEKLMFGEGKTTILKSMGGRKPIVVDLDEAMGISFKSKNFITPAKITKTPLWKTFKEEVAVEKIKDIIKTHKPKPFTFDYADDVTAQVQKQIFEDSKYAGTGLYERTESVAGGLTQTQINSQVNQLLKTGIDPIINIKTQIKDLLNLDQAVLSTTGLKVGTATLTGLNINQLLKSELKSDMKLGQELKLDLGLKQDMSLKTLLKEGQLLKQTQALKQGLKLQQALKLQTVPVSSISPIFTEPVIPEFKMPTVPIIPIPFWFPSAKSKVKKKLDEKKLMQELLYLPDFTSRSLGLDPEVLTLKQAQKRIGKVQTGFEIRRGIKLLKGIPD